MPTLHAHSYELFLIARKASQDARADAARPNALTTDSVVAVVMAAAAAEAFLNELAYHTDTIRVNTADWAPTAVTSQLAACASVLRELEDAKASVTAKYLIASLVLSGKSFERARAPYQDFATLMDLRNEVMHAKPVRGDAGHRGTKILAALEQRGIAQRLFPGVPTSWLHVLESPGVGAWACDAALGIIRAVLDLSPPPQPPTPDPLTLLRQFKKPFLDHA